jgi:hypothetical protein
MEMQPELTPEPEQNPPEFQILDLTDLPDVSGAADAEPPRGKHHRPDNLNALKPPPTGPPNAGEWQDFYGNIVLRMLTEGYLNLVLYREIDEADLTEREKELITLTKDDLRQMAAPMAQFSAKNKTMRKHGRTVIAAAESYEALVDLFIWMRRVNKIAKRHRKPRVAENIAESEVINNGYVPDQNGEARQTGGFTIFNRGTG